MRSAWSVLAALDLEQPGALDTTLGHPYIRAWAVRCLERFGPAASRPDGERQGISARDLHADLGHLGAIAAVTAVRGQMGAAVTIPIMNGAVHLPTLGRLVLGAEEGMQDAGSEPEPARVNVISNAVIICAGESCWSLDLTGLLAGEPCATAVPGNTRSGEWQPRRFLCGAGFRVALEDTDPYRDCHPALIAPRLTDAEAAQWQREFQAAWQEIEREHTEYAASLAAGLTALTPLLAGRGDREVSAASRNAFGAVAMALPTDGHALARLLISDFQHVKLGALLDLCDLYDVADDRLFQAPWGEGKQQMEDLLQSGYAHLAVTDFWREHQRFSDGPAAETARQWFERWHSETAEAIETLLGSGALTPIGASFVQQMRHSVNL